MGGSTEGGEDVRSLRSRMRLAVSTAVIALCGAALLGAGAPLVAAGSSATASVWVQTMDSCKQALPDAQYQVIGNGIDLRLTTPSGSKQALSSSTCPLQQGSCSSIHTGCLLIPNLAPGTYRIHELKTPNPDTSNPEGYAACNGGSACQQQDGALTVSSSGVAAGRVTNVYPDGTVAVYPSGKAAYAGTSGDPIVVHNFGLAPPGSGGNAQCDGDGDADDHSTGSPSSRCGYPESKESSACRPFPWSCTLAPIAPPTTSTTTASTSTGTTTSSTTTTMATTTTTTTTTTSTSTNTTASTSTTTSTGCGLTDTTVGMVKTGTSTKVALATAASGPLHATLTWSPAATVRLRLVDQAPATVTETTATGTSLTLDATALAAGKYSFRLMLTGAKSVTFSLAASHC